MTDNNNPEDTDPHKKEAQDLWELLKSDPKGAFKALEALAPQSVTAMLLLGGAYAEGLGTDRDAAAAEACNRRAAEAGSPMGTFNIGNWCARRGDDQQAIKFYDRAATLGHPQAKEAASNLRIHEAVALAKSDPARAHAEFRTLAEEGSTWGMVHLAWTYKAGSGTDQDLKQAESWYRRAFQEGPDVVKTQASYFLGEMYQERGDYAKAREMYQQGMDHGFARSFYRMGQLYVDGLGVEKDPKKARSFYERAASLGNVYALRNLAWQDLSGHFGPINFFRGFPRLLRAARGMSASLEQRGEMWVLVPKDRNVPLIGQRARRIQAKRRLSLTRLLVGLVTPFAIESIYLLLLRWQNLRPSYTANSAAIIVALGIGGAVLDARGLSGFQRVGLTLLYVPIAVLAFFYFYIAGSSIFHGHL